MPQHQAEEPQMSKIETNVSANETNETEIETWAKAPENKERAKALGLRLIRFAKQPDELLKQPSLGAFEDKAQRWAVANQMKAKMLLMRLAKLFM